VAIPLIAMAGLLAYAAGTSITNAISLDHVPEQPEHGDKRDRHQKIYSEPYGSTTRSHGSLTIQTRGREWPPRRIQL